jgi:hypothetical protein
MKKKFDIFCACTTNDDLEKDLRKHGTTFYKPLCTVNRGVEIDTVKELPHPMLIVTHFLLLDLMSRSMTLQNSSHIQTIL